jgi:hypothetical protein
MPVEIKSCQHKVIGRENRRISLEVAPRSTFVAHL